MGVRAAARMRMLRGGRTSLGASLLIIFACFNLHCASLAAVCQARHLHMCHNGLRVTERKNNNRSKTPLLATYRQCLRIRRNATQLQ